MHRSTQRILSTHVGSLARPPDLLDLMGEKEHGRPYDADGFAKRVTAAVADVVAAQVRAGLDVVTDGEMGKVSFLTYVKDRLTGFDASAGERLMPPSWQVEIDAFPDYYAGYLGKYKDQVSPMTTMVCTGPITYDGHEQLRTDIDNLRAALDGHAVTEAFLPSTSPSGFGRNEHYGSHGEYLAAVAEALREEYLAIVEAGFLLQIDDPWLIEYISENPAIADTIVLYAGIVGRENVIAGADCGFSSRASYHPEVHPTVVWEKFRALAEGARLASRHLWP